MSKLPQVTCERIVPQEEYDRVEDRVRGHIMSRREREAQKISFVWGNDPDRSSTKQEVRRHLNRK